MSINKNLDNVSCLFVPFSPTLDVSNSEGCVKNIRKEELMEKKTIVLGSGEENVKREANTVMSTIKKEKQVFVC